MSVFGGMSKGERTRIKIGVKAAVGAQAKDEGRFHGKRLHKLDLDPEAAPVVKRICDCKLAQYRAALDANANSVTVAAWIAEIEAEKARYQIAARPAGTRHRRMSEAEIHDRHRADHEVFRSPRALRPRAAMSMTSPGSRVPVHVGTDSTKFITEEEVIARARADC
jgi:hypothetical protein